MNFSFVWLVLVSAVSCSNGAFSRQNIILKAKEFEVLLYNHKFAVYDPRFPASEHKAQSEAKAWWVKLAVMNSLTWMVTEHTDVPLKFAAYYNYMMYVKFKNHFFAHQSILEKTDFRLLFGRKGTFEDIKAFYKNDDLTGSEEMNLISGWLKHYSEVQFLLLQNIIDEEDFCIDSSVTLNQFTKYVRWHNAAFDIPETIMGMFPNVNMPLRFIMDESLEAIEACVRRVSDEFMFGADLPDWIHAKNLPIWMRSQAIHPQSIFGITTVARRHFLKLYSRVFRGVLTGKDQDLKIRIHEALKGNRNFTVDRLFQSYQANLAIYQSGFNQRISAIERALKSLENTILKFVMKSEEKSFFLSMFATCRFIQDHLAVLKTNGQEQQFSVFITLDVWMSTLYAGASAVLKGSKLKMPTSRCVSAVKDLLSLSDTIIEGLDLFYSLAAEYCKPGREDVLELVEDVINITQTVRGIMQVLTGPESYPRPLTKYLERFSLCERYGEYVIAQDPKKAISLIAKAFSSLSIIIGKQEWPEQVPDSLYFFFLSNPDFFDLNSEQRNRLTSLIPSEIKKQHTELEKSRDAPWTLSYKTGKTQKGAPKARPRNAKNNKPVLRQEVRQENQVETEDEIIPVVDQKLVEPKELLEEEEKYLPVHIINCVNKIDMENAPDIDARDIALAHILIGDHIYRNYLKKFIGFMKYKEEFYGSQDLLRSKITIDISMRPDVVACAMRVAGIPSVDFLRKCLAMYQRRMRVVHPIIPKDPEEKGQMIKDYLQILAQFPGKERLFQFYSKVFGIQEKGTKPFEPISTLNRPLNFWTFENTETCLAILGLFHVAACGKEKGEIANILPTVIIDHRNRWAHPDPPKAILRAYISFIFKDSIYKDFLTSLVK